MEGGPAEGMTLALDLLASLRCHSSSKAPPSFLTGDGGRRMSWQLELLPQTSHAVLGNSV